MVKTLVVSFLSQGPCMRTWHNEDDDDDELHSPGFLPL